MDAKEFEAIKERDEHKFMGTDAEIADLMVIEGIKAFIDRHVLIAEVKRLGDEWATTVAVMRSGARKMREEIKRKNEALKQIVALSDRDTDIDQDAWDAIEIAQNALKFSSEVR